MCVRPAGCAAGSAGWVTLFSAGTARGSAVHALLRELLQFLLGPHGQLWRADCATSGVETLKWMGLITQWVPSNVSLASCAQK